MNNDCRCIICYYHLSKRQNLMFICTNISVYCLTSSSLQTVVTCLRIDWNKRWNWTWGILCHSSYSLCCNCRRKFWSGWCMPIRLSNWSQRWSMGFTPGDTDGQGNTVKFWSRRMSTVVRSGVVVLKNLSHSLWILMTWKRWGWSISLRYLCAAKLPGTRTSGTSDCKK